MFLMLVIICLMVTASATAQPQLDWPSLEERLPNAVYIDWDAPPPHYRFARGRERANIPYRLTVGGDTTIQELAYAMEHEYIDSTVGWILRAQLKDDAALEKFSADVVDAKRLKPYVYHGASVVPFVLFYNLPQEKWLPLFEQVLAAGPSYVTPAIIYLLTQKDIAISDSLYWKAYPTLDSLSQKRVIQELADAKPDEELLVKAFIQSGVPGTQLWILDRLETMHSSVWPEKADSLALHAWGDAAVRMLPHIDTSDTSVYYPVLRAIAYAAQDVKQVKKAILTLADVGDTSAIPAIKIRFSESDRELRVVTGIALCLLGDDLGVGACINLGLESKKYRKRVIAALEHISGQDYGGNEKKWRQWFKESRKY